jgi:hypothetical protein
MAYEIEKDWITESGYRAVVIRILASDKVSLKHRCGYVAVDQNNPAYGKGYHEQIDAISQEEVDSTTLGIKSPILALTAMVGSDDEHSKIRRSIDVLIDVHGGVTFSSEKTKGDYPVDYENLWWFGYDCAHYGDDESIGGQSLKYCIHQCELMAAQLKTLSTPSSLLLKYKEQTDDRA